MKKIAVVLSGCGFLDGAEIHEAVLTLLALDQAGAAATCCAPDVDQAGVVDHRTHKPAEGGRNVLTESARIARGKIEDIRTIRASDFDALLLPGGFGAAKNLCDFATNGAQCAVNADVERVIAEFFAARKPIGAICIAPALVARVAGKLGRCVKLTIGSDAGAASAIAAMGCAHEAKAVSEICVDSDHRVVSTPAYMLGPGPAAVWDGIRACVKAVLELC